MPSAPGRAVRRPWPRLLVALLLGLAAGPAGAAAPATAPDDAGPAASQVPAAPSIATGDLDRARLAPLVKMCAKLNERRWGPAVVETFEKAPAKDVWHTQMGQTNHKDGRLVASVPDNGGMVVLSRSLPQAARDSEGIRVDFWLDAQPMAVGGNVKIEFYYLSMFLATDNPNLLQWDYTYMFALSRNGNMQQFQAQSRGVFQSAVADDFKKDKLVRVRMEIVGPQVFCQRGDNKPLTHRDDQILPLRTDDRTIIGLMGQCRQIRVAKVVVRPLAPSVEPATLNEQWKSSPFVDQPALTRCLGERVVPHLDDPRFPVRREAADLLTSLWPLSRPAIEAAAKSPPPRFTPEGVLRLEALRLYVPPVTVLDAAVADAADAPPPDVPPTTQPEKSP